jgi:phenylalanyl-tRNA synthetase beta chain
MKISYNWLKQFVDITASPEELSLVLTGIGLEVESLDVVQAVPGGLEGLVIGEVKSCVPHPNADRLRVTQVDAGTGEVLQIVCGAPNVAAGQKVVVALVGTTVYPTQGEPFKINKSKIRGEVSMGMICAEDEIGLGESHEGIMVLPEDAPVGLPAKDYFKLNDDYVFEIGLTPNRADAASHLGVARDIAAYYRTSLKYPTLSDLAKSGLAAVYPVEILSTDARRYTSCLIKGVKVADSPAWLKEKLAVIGLRPINNVVDVTNYVLHGLGQPLHAFDADKIEGGKVVVRKAKAGEKFVTLDGIERSLDAEDLVICDSQKPMCLAGVFGGANSGVSEETTSVFLESAWFDAVSIRKSSKRHGLKTDASFRFERGTDPNMPLMALNYAVDLLKEVAGGEIATAVSDIYENPAAPFEFEVNYGRVQRLIGKAIPAEEIKAIIASLGIQITHEDAENLQVAVPPFKVDVTREVDVIEEVLRIYGYNKVEIGTQLKASLNQTPKPDKELYKNTVSELLVGNGFLEIMNNSLTNVETVFDESSAVRLYNPLSSDLDTMRQNMVFSLLEAIEYNQKRKNADVKFFEFGKTYHLEGDQYREDNHLAIAVTGKAVANHWKVKDEPSGFYHLKGVMDGLFQKLGIQDMEVSEVEGVPYAYGLKYVKNNAVLATFGAVHPRLLKKADVNGQVFFADVNWDAVMKVLRKHKVVFKEISKFPAVRRDLALLLDNQVPFEQLKNIAIRTERKYLKEVNVFDVYKGDKLPEGKKSYALSFILQDEEKTMDDKRIDAIISKLITNFEKETGAVVRS